LRRPRRHQRVGRDIGAVADHRVLVDDRLVMNDHVATEDAARQARTAPGLDAVPVDHALEHRAALDHAAVADDQRADELRLGLDEATRADEHGRLDAHARIDLRPRADPHAGLDLASRHVELDAAEQRVEVAEPVLLDVADVVPVALESPAVKRCVGSQQSREDVARPVDEDAGGYIVEDRRLEGVNAAVAEIGERVGGGGFLLEARDTGRGVVDDDAVERWVVDLLHGQGRDAPVAPVSRHKGREVDVGEPVAADALSDLCNCGIYAFEPAIFDYVLAGVFVDWARDVFPALLAADAPIYCWRLESYWNDVGNIEQYRLSNFDALLGRVKLDVPGRQIQPRVWVGPGTQIDPGVRIEAPVLIGAGCLVESEAELIGPLIVGDGCVIERGAVLEGMIHWDGVKTGRGSRLAGSILGRNVVVHHEAVVHEDAVIGDRADVAPHALVSPGARIEPRSCVGPDGFCRDSQRT